MRSRTQATRMQLANLGLVLGAGMLLASCSLIVDSELDKHPSQPYPGPGVCTLYCPQTASYATQAYLGGPCTCPGLDAGSRMRCGELGFTVACSCPKGPAGTQTCDGMTTFSACKCSSVPPTGDDAGDMMDAGHDGDAG